MTAPRSAARAGARRVAPYFDNGQCVIYHGLAEDVLPTIDPASVALVLTDPPYGISLDTANAKRGRGRLVQTAASKARKKQQLADATDYAPVYGDDQPYDPSILLRFPRLVLFGANHFATRLPESAAWLVWDKTAGLTSTKRAIGICDNADAELIWTNLGGPVRILGHQWLGLIKATERGQARVHPTQKPVALIRWLIEMFTEPGDLILDPYLGSGTTARACADTGRRCIGVEYSEDYCRIAVDRLAQMSLIGAVS